MPILSPDQVFHLESLANDNCHAPELDEQTELARLAGVGDTEGLMAAMERMPQANPALAVAWAAENGSLDCLHLCLARFDPGSFHPMAAALAAQYGQADCLSALTSTRGDEAGMADALRAACAGGHESCVRVLIDAPGGVMPDLDRAPTADREGLGAQSALDWCAESGAETSVDLLLEDIAKRHPSSCLLLAARHGRHDIVERLLADPTCSDMLSESLYEACAHGHIECAKLLLPMSDPRFDKNAPLVYAASNGHAECVELLLPLVDPSLDSFAALTQACSEGHARCADILIDACPPPQSLAAPLLLAAMHSGDATCVHLVASRLGCEHRDDSGRTPLICAIDMIEGTLEDRLPDGSFAVLGLVEALISAGARIDADDGSKGPLDLARAIGGKELVHAIQAMAARRDALSIEKAASLAPPRTVSKPRI